MATKKSAERAVFNASSVVEFVSTRDWDLSKFSIEYHDNENTLFVILDTEKVDLEARYVDPETKREYVRYNESVPQHLVKGYLEVLKGDENVATWFIFKDDCVLIDFPILVDSFINYEMVFDDDKVAEGESVDFISIC